ncbi:MAG: Hsp20/alpha crystallin family protein [Candidatus Edwardsbacteria bacterium]|jgi:HSP20 family protein|nr:Hsp20/alpha crystallin family protein [Candidatus Edwardsbacteria bacterium]
MTNDEQRAALGSRVRSDLGRLFHDLTEIVQPVYSLDDESVWHPFGDIYETDRDLVIKLELAGVSTTDLSISVSGDQLSVNGVRKDVAECDARRTYLKMEINHGRFSKLIVLPDHVSRQDIRSVYKDGILEIRLAKVAKQVLEVKID